MSCDFLSRDSWSRDLQSCDFWSHGFRSRDFWSRDFRSCDFRWEKTGNQFAVCRGTSLTTVLYPHAQLLAQVLCYSKQHMFNLHLFGNAAQSFVPWQRMEWRPQKALSTRGTTRFLPMDLVGAIPYSKRSAKQAAPLPFRHLKISTNIVFCNSLVLSCQSLSCKAFKYGKIKDLNIHVIAHLQMFYQINHL